MKTYNYLEAVTADVLNYINENNITVTNETRDEVEQQLNDDLWACDSVTSNASGSYTFSAWQAEENICHNLGLLAEACDELGSDTANQDRKSAKANGKHPGSTGASRSCGVYRKRIRPRTAQSPLL